MRPEIVFSAVLLAATGPAAPGATPSGRRADLAPLQSVLETAVSSVARPVVRMGALPGRSGARAYRLPGYGAMIILAPRALPAVTHRMLVRTQEAPLVVVPVPSSSSAAALDEAARSLEASLAGQTSDASRREIERSLARLRAAQKRLEGSQTRVMVRTKTSELVTAEEIENLQREMQARMAEQAEMLSEMERNDDDLAQRGALRAHLLAVQAQVEAMRQEAERTRRLAEREVWVQLAPEPPSPPTTATPAAAPVATVPPVPAPASVAPAAPVPPVAAVPPVPPAAAPAPVVAGEDGDVPPPPWRFWFPERRGSREAPRDARTPEKVMADVKDALLAALAQPKAALTGLAADDSIVIAVDFQPEQLSLRPRAERTVVARVRVKDVLARRAGTLSAEEFRRKVEFEED